ncbi:MAG: hypothetical protein WD379_06970 [Dehalococcoidia bacterium]
MAYFLLAVSTRHNLDLCIKHALAGFTDSISGLWTFLDIQEGDFVSFLYGARAYNLYQVSRRAAYKNSQGLPPWPPLILKPSGRTYHFPFRLELTPVRALEEPLVRAEFAYVAENLLLRGGYRKTHFQADQTTLQHVSEMGVPSSPQPEPLNLGNAETFTPGLVRHRKDAQPPATFALRELIIQTLLRRHLSAAGTLNQFLTGAGIHRLDTTKLEALGEKAFPEGHVDILIKEATPMGMSRKVVVEVKFGAATSANIEQLRLYMERLGEECAGGVLVAGSFGKRILNRAAEHGIACSQYSLEGIGETPLDCDSLLSHFRVTPVSA